LPDNHHIGYEERVSVAIRVDAEGRAEGVLAQGDKRVKRRVSTCPAVATSRRPFLPGGPLARALLALVVVALIAGCWGGGGPGAAYYADLLESLEVPAGWELAHTREREGMFGPNACGPGNFSCPGAHRYYHVSGEPVESYPAAKQLLIDAGFEIAKKYYPDCDGVRQGFIPCQLDGAREADIVTVHLYEPGRDVDDLGIAREGFFITELRGYQNPEARGNP
jgi:hypothetical protein